MSAFENLRKKAAGTTDSKSKSKTPTVKVEDEKLSDAVRRFLIADRDQKDASARIDDAKGELMKFASDKRVELSRKDKKLYPSVKLDAQDNGSVMFTQTAKMCKMKTEDAEDILKSRFTSKFDSFFKIKDNISVRDDISDEDAAKLVKTLTKAFGERLLDIISINPEIVATSEFFNQVVLDKEIESITEKVRETNGDLLKLNSPSFKTVVSPKED